MENLSRCHREKSGKRLLPHSTYILQHKNDIVKNNKYAETVVFCFIKPKKRKINNSVCRKSMFFKKSACPQSLSPLGHSVGFASCKAWCVLISASLPKAPFPWKGAILLGLLPLDPARMHAVSRTKPLHDAVAQMADDLYGGSAQSKDALVACQKFCTMQNQQSKQRSTPHY